MSRKKKYIVKLTTEQRKNLKMHLKSGEHSSRKLTRIRILLKADQGKHGPGWTDDEIAEAFGVTSQTVFRKRKKFCEQGLKATINRKKYETTKSKKKLDGKQEAKLIALAMSEAPEGRSDWTLRLLADKMVEMEIVDEISHETVRQYLKKTNSSLGQSSHG